jgi:hypothetical protein
MAILLRGKTSCPLCGEIIGQDDEVRGFPAFLKPTHRLGKFSDAAFHVRCLIGSDEAADAQSLYEKWLAIWDKRPTDLKSVAEMDAWGKAAFAEFTAEAERLDIRTPPTPDS